MNLDDLKEIATARFAGQVDYQGPTKVVNGCAVVARNMRFSEDKALSRYGTRTTMGRRQSPVDVTGIDVLNVLGENNPGDVAVIFDEDGDLLTESPAGSGALVPLSPPFALPTGARMQAAQGANSEYMAFTDGIKGLCPPLVLDGPTRRVSRISQNRIGALWDPTALYAVGDLFRSPDGRWWRCTVPSNGLGGQLGPVLPALNGQFIGSPLLGVNASSATIPWEGLVAPFAAGPWYVYVTNGTSASQFFGSFTVSVQVVTVGGHAQATFLRTFQVSIPADPGLSTWTIYIGSAPTLGTMTQKFTVTGTAAPQTFVASIAPVATAAPIAPAGVWSPAVATDTTGGTQWEEWTPACANQLPAPDVVNTAPTLSHTPGAGTIPAGKDVYIKLAFHIGNGESSRSAPLVFINTSANDLITVGFGNNGGLRIPRWIAEINLQSLFLSPADLHVYVAAVATGAAVPADSAYILYGGAQSLGASIVISALSSTPTLVGPSANSGNFQNPTFAYDGDLSSSSVGIAGTSANPLSVSETWSGFAAGSALNQSLKIKSRAGLSKVPGVNVKLEYSLNGGATWITVYSLGAGGVRFITTDVITLANGQALANIQVRASARASGGSPSGAISAVYEIWIDSNTSPFGSTVGPAYILSLNPQTPPIFIGESGTRYMAVLRKDRRASLTALDPGSVQPVVFQGRVSTNIITISRDGAGNVKATVADITNLAVGETVNVQGCLGDSTLNGSGFIVGSIQATVKPEGIVSFVSSTLVATSDQTGELILPAGPPPVAFLPSGGPDVGAYIAAFTVAGAGRGGPFFYISEAIPDDPPSASIVSLQGGSPLTQNVVSMLRSDGGYVQCQLADITGIAVGQSVLVEGTTGFPFMEGQFTVSNVEATPASAPGGFVYWQNPATSPAGPCATGKVTVFIGQIATVQAELQASDGLEAGQDVLITGSSNPAFNDFARIAVVNGKVVTLAMDVAGSSVGGTLTVIPVLPTEAPGQAQTIVSISRDASGNVTAEVTEVEGYTSGQMIFVGAVTNASFDGLREITQVATNPDGISGQIFWKDVAGAAAISSGGTIVGFPHIIAEFDDVTLADEINVTGQLTAFPAPNASDVYYVPSLQRVAYVDNDRYPGAVVLSNEQDPANITGDSGDPNNPGSGILQVQDNKTSRAICMREMKDGEVLLVKDNGGFAIEPSSLLPSQWSEARRWKEYGPPCAAAVALGNNFLAFAAKKGAYIWMGGKLDWISKELTKTWERINWDASNQIWCEVDEEAHEVHFGVPLDCEATPNYDLVCNYEAGWEFPETLSRYGKLITARDCRKWSVNPFAARTARVVKRTITAPAPSQGPQSYAFTNITRTNGLVVATYIDAGHIPPIAVPGGLIAIQVPSNPTFNGTFTVIAKTTSPATLSWLQNVVATLAIISDSWAPSGGNTLVTMILPGAVPVGFIVGSYAYLTGTGVANGYWAVASVTPGVGQFTITFVVTPAATPGTGSETGVGTAVLVVPA